MSDIVYLIKEQLAHVTQHLKPSLIDFLSQVNLKNMGNLYCLILFLGSSCQVSDIVNLRVKIKQPAHVAQQLKPSQHNVLVPD